MAILRMLLRVCMPWHGSRASFTSPRRRVFRHARTDGGAWKPFHPAIVRCAKSPLAPYSGDVRPDVDASYDPLADPTVRTIGMMGSAGGVIPEATRRLCYQLGVAIAKSGCVLITGACPGLPYDCACGARDTGGLSVGVSPALSRSEHVLKYASPVDAYDVIIFTGSGLMGREVHNIHSSDIVIIAGGHSGTLGEFSIAYDEGKLIGVLTGSGGIADDISRII